MNKEQVLEKLTSYYEEEMKENGFYQQSKENQDLLIKLKQTTDLFVRSFDYDLSVGHTFKAKIANLIRRVIRRSTRFITKPYADKMQGYNESVCELLGQMIQQYGEKMYSMSQVVEVLQRKIDEEHEKNYSLTIKSNEHQEMIEGIKTVLNDTVNKTLEMGGQLATLSQGARTVADSSEFESYSQAGEDRIVSFILSYGERKNKKLSYLDIGCNHYKRLNNTYGLYKKGYRGVLVEANPTMINDIVINRPGDIVLNVGISRSSGEKQTFYIVNGDGLSSFDKESIDNAKKETPWLEIVDKVEVPLMDINSVIKEYCNMVPDVVSIDVEGAEMDILETFDFEKYRPYIFIVETISYAANIQLDRKRTDILQYMSEKEYGEFAFTGINSIFIDKKQLV